MHPWAKTTKILHETYTQTYVNTPSLLHKWVDNQHSNLTIVWYKSRIKEENVYYKIEYQENINS